MSNNSTLAPGMKFKLHKLTINLSFQLFIAAIKTSITLNCVLMRTYKFINFIKRLTSPSGYLRYYNCKLTTMIRKETTGKELWKTLVSVKEIFSNRGLSYNLIWTWGCYSSSISRPETAWWSSSLSRSSLNSEFSFSLTGCYAKVKQFSLSNYLPLVRGRIVGFITSQGYSCYVKRKRLHSGFKLR